MTIVIHDNGTTADPTNVGQEEAAANPSHTNGATMPRTATKPSPSGRKMIRWTDAEQQMLAKNLATMRLNQPYENMTSLLNKAQQQLPDGRRRNIYNFKKDTYSVAELFEAEMVKLQEAARRGTKMPEPAPVPVVESQPVLTAEELLSDMPDEALAYYLRERQLGLDLLLPVVADRVVSLISNVGSLHNTLGTVAANMAANVNENFKVLHGRLDKLETKVGVLPTRYQPQPNQDRTGKMPRITIVGLTGGQIQDLMRACQAYAHLKFVDREKRIHVNDFPVCDWCVLMTKSIGHEHQSQAIAAYGRSKIVFVNGALSQGIQNVIDLSRRFAAGENPPEGK